ncbi:hypothetical protein ITP53_34365 [Nonomuraea sp. K274]|uniref:Uncharacterized protein n=1 Tax=Nonomuraea cypriaca TaxID=1187855 RepID=A0A931AI17_9ACTN|nr:hypothetical protein [Nonomuraea cypriaca]MBF8190709.1 hypothetical protein [Nonomuraea cypriaca]
MIESPLHPPLAVEEPGRRIVLAGLVGIILPIGLLAWVWLWLMVNLFPERCGHFGCFGYLFQAWEIGRWVAALLAWPLLYLLRVRPAWPVAMLAAFFLSALWSLGEALFTRRFGVSLTLILYSGVIAFPLAARMAMPRVSHRLLIWVIGLFLALHTYAILLHE